MCYNSRHSSIVINSFVNTFPVNLVSIDWDDQKFESLELLLLLNFGGTSGACGGRGNVLIDSGISKSSAYHVLSGRDDRFQLGVTFAEHKPTANMETLDAGYFADRSSAGSLALSRSKSGHQLPLQRVKSGAPTAEHVHQPLDISQSLSSALEFGARKRRNSFSHLFNRQRASSEQFTSSTFSSLQQQRPSSAQKQHSKYRYIRLPFVSNKEPAANPDLTVLKLEDSFADIRLQLVSCGTHSPAHLKLNIPLFSAGEHVAGDTGLLRPCADSVACCYGPILPTGHHAEGRGPSRSYHSLQPSCSGQPQPNYLL